MIVKAIQNFIHKDGEHQKIGDVFFAGDVHGNFLIANGLAEEVKDKKQHKEEAKNDKKKHK